MLMIVQIPCLNEEASIASVIRDIPRDIEGVERVEILVIDDGSKDGTVLEAKKAGADHVLSFPFNRGLARAFEAGIDKALELGADVIVNIDGDGQYRGEDVPAVAGPVLRGEADVAVGDRGIKGDPSYPAVKKSLQVAGSAAVRRISGTDIIDATSGFRAYSREAAQRLVIVSDFTYTLESLIQAGSDHLRVKSVPVETRRVERPSRLFGSIPEYLAKSASTMVRIYAMYRPLKIFSAVGAAIFASGFAIGLWFLFYFVTMGGKGHVQLLILAAVLMIIGFQVVMMGLLADLIGANRKLMRDLLYRMKKIESQKGTDKKGGEEDR